LRVEITASAVISPLNFLFPTHAQAAARAKVLQRTQDMNNSIFYIIGVIVVIVVVLKLLGLW
jgi:hypothetical protein